MIIKQDAIVLKSINYSNSSQIVTLYTKNYGKISFIAKGSRNNKSKKFSGSFEPTLHVEVVYRQKNVGALCVVREFDIVDHFYNVRKSLERIYNALYLVDFVNECTTSHDSSQGLFQLLQTSLKYLSLQANCEKVRYFFQVKALVLIGLLPYFRECYYCGRKFTERAIFFDTNESAIVCRKCQTKIMGRFLEISLQTLKILQSLELIPWEGLKKISLSQRVIRELDIFFCFYLQSMLDKNLRTFKFLGKKT